MTYKDNFPIFNRLHRAEKRISTYRKTDLRKHAGVIKGIGNVRVSLKDMSEERDGLNMSY